jgi:diacylglycerol kinase (ATP)
LSELRPTGRTVVVANPTAGRGKGGKLIGKAAQILHDLGVEHEIQVSESAEDLERKARSAAEAGAAIVAVIGGDGSVSAAANGVLGTDATLAVFPGGTGDDFAKAIGAGKFVPAVKLLANPKSQAIDVVRLTTGPSVRHFVNVAGAGFDSEVNETANAMKIDLGSTGTYIAAVLKTLSKFTPAHYEIAIDDQMLSLDAMLAIVGSGISYGGGMKVLPSASLIDGVLDVCIVESLSKMAFLRAFPRVFNGSHTTHPRIQMHRGKRITMEANRRMNVHADGEQTGPLPAIFEVLPSALRVVIGPGAKGIR